MRILRQRSAPTDSSGAVYVIASRSTTYGIEIAGRIIRRILRDTLICKVSRRLMRVYGREMSWRVLSGRFFRKCCPSATPTIAQVRQSIRESNCRCKRPV